MIRQSVILTLAIAVVAPLDSFGWSNDPAKVAEAKTDGTEGVSQLPALPEVEIQPATDGNQPDALTEKIRDLIASADQSDSPANKVELLLAGANLILAHQLEPACTQKLLEIRAGSIDRSKVSRMLDQADGLIRQAQEEVDKDRAEPIATLDAMRDRLTTLSAFAGAMRAYLTNSRDDEASNQLRRAVSGLSPVMEDSDAMVAAAAGLWQAVLRAADNDVTRAIDSLPYPSANLDKDALPYPFFAKQIRCRLHGVRGGHAVAMAMLIQLEDRSEDWFAKESDQEDAYRTTRWMQLRTLADWYESLDASSHGDERKWCSDRMESIIVDSFQSDKKTVMRLSPSIPLLFPAPVTVTAPVVEPVIDN